MQSPLDNVLRLNWIHFQMTLYLPQYSILSDWLGLNSANGVIFYIVCLLYVESYYINIKTQFCFWCWFQTTMDKWKIRWKQSKAIAELLANVNSAYLTDAEKYEANAHVQNALKYIVQVYLLLLKARLKKSSNWNIKSRFRNHFLLHTLNQYRFNIKFNW